MDLDDRARALLDALNELFVVDWVVVPGPIWYRYKLHIDIPDRLPFVYERDIKPAHINGEPFRTALKFADEVCERLGRYLLLKPDDCE